MKIGFTSSPFLANKLIAVYAVAITAVAGGILLIPAQAPTPNVVYNLFKIGQTSVDQTLVANGWKPVGYACQSANPSQIAQGFGPTVCGFSYTTASHNLITTGGIDWLACKMINTNLNHCPAMAQYIALSTSASAPAAGDCAAGSNACTLTSEITSGTDSGLVRAASTYTNAQAHTNGSATYQAFKQFTAAASDVGVQKSGLFTQSSSGVMVFENTFSSTNMISGDTLAVTWTVTL